jgi:hypothetical protein
MSRQCLSAVICLSVFLGLAGTSEAQAPPPFSATVTTLSNGIKLVDFSATTFSADHLRVEMTLITQSTGTVPNPLTFIWTPLTPTYGGPWFYRTYAGHEGSTSVQAGSGTYRVLLIRVDANGFPIAVLNSGTLYL